MKFFIVTCHLECMKRTNDWYQVHDFDNLIHHLDSEPRRPLRPCLAFARSNTRTRLLGLNLIIHGLFGTIINPENYFKLVFYIATQLFLLVQYNSHKLVQCDFRELFITFPEEFCASHTSLVLFQLSRGSVVLSPDSVWVLLSPSRGPYFPFKQTDTDSSGNTCVWDSNLVNNKLEQDWETGTIPCLPRKCSTAFSERTSSTILSRWCWQIL